MQILTQISTVFRVLKSSGIFRMTLQRVSQTAYNRLRVEGGFKKVKFKYLKSGCYV
jgi:hypothetical protein